MKYLIIIILTLLFSSMTPIFKVYDVESVYLKEVKNPTIVNDTFYWSNKLNLDYKILFAIMYVESRYKPQIVNYNKWNNSYDYGLFQLNNKVYHNYTKKELFKRNIELGCKHYQASLELANGNELEALVYYGWGYGRRNDISIGAIQHIEKTLNYKKHLEGLYE
jgi:soluble lytic murein transglycosylase-like protein